MAKTEEELTELKAEYEKLRKELAELTEDELKKVTGGTVGQDHGIGPVMIRKDYD